MKHPAFLEHRCPAVLLLFILFFAAFPCVSAQIKPAGIDIVRDTYGVPHIFAKTDAEVAYGLAWAHCEDDFHTIQTCFLAAKGLLGRVTGKDGAAIDFVVQLIRARELADRRYDSDLSEDYKRVLEGYCAGFNRFAETHPKELRHPKVAPIAPRDMMTYAILQMFVFTGGPQALQDILNNKTPVASLPVAHGSNGYAFNSNKTKDGQTYLAINSHQPWEGIVAWYEAHLCSEAGWNILGGLFPGAPNILVGCNENLGWAHTVNNPDKLDVYQLEINPDNNKQYRFDDQWLTLEERSIPLKVKIAGIPVGIRKKAWYSVHGPVLKNKKGRYAIRSSGMFDVRALEQWYRMNKARNFTEFYHALKMEAIPGFNVVYADRYDTIYYVSNGKLPVREKGYDWKGVLPGNTSKTLWNRFHPLEALPQTLNPASGYLFNSNHSPFNASATPDNLKAEHFDPTMGYETHENNRSRRFMELIAPLEKLDYADFKRIKYDQQLPAQISYAVDFDSLFMLDARRFPDVEPLITALKSWNRRSDVQNTGAPILIELAGYISKKYHIKDIYTRKTLTQQESLDALRHTKRHFLRHFGRLEVPLGEYQRLVRGKKEYALSGLPDAIAAIYSIPHKKGRVRGMVGDCYIELVRFTPTGPAIETSNVFGASNRPESPHYDDQADLFVNQKTKPMTLNKKEVYAAAKRVYHPE
jgi:acyl-homoserine-lactone acylase